MLVRVLLYSRGGRAYPTWARGVGCRVGPGPHQKAERSVLPRTLIRVGGRRVFKTHTTNNKPIMYSNRSTNGLWKKKTSFYCIRPPPMPPQVNAIVVDTRTKSELLQYLHAACFSPPKST